MDTDQFKVADGVVVHNPQLGTTKFSNVGEVRQLIKQLQQVEQDMEKNVSTPAAGSGGENGYNNTVIDFESVPLIDLNELKLESDHNWLLDTGRNYTHTDTDTSYLDSRLLSIRYDLLNKVKQALDDDKANQISARVKRNTSYVVRRDVEPQEFNMPFFSSPKRQDVSATYTYRVPKTRASPGRISIFSQDHDHDQETDGNQMPSPILADENSPGSPALNRTITLMKTPQSVDKYATVTRSTKLGTTFTASPVDGGVQHEVRTHGCNELNTTFTRSSEDEAISSPSGSAHSPKNTSMEELQSKARQQEQRLRDTPIRRKDTHVIEYHQVTEAQAKLSSRTSSADTYCLTESNPDSGASSGVSSPRDSQSCENMQLAPTSIRRSMPNLAHLKDAQRGGKPSLQVMSSSCQIRTQPRYTSDPKLSVSKSPTRTVNMHRESTSKDYNTYGRQSNSNKNQNQIPAYTRGDTFSRPRVLSIPQNGHQAGYNQGAFVGNVQRSGSDHRTFDRQMMQSQVAYPESNSRYESHGTYKAVSNGQRLSYARPSILPTAATSTVDTEKPKSRIPAPGSRLRHF